MPPKSKCSEPSKATKCVKAEGRRGGTMARAAAQAAAGTLPSTHDPSRGDVQLRHNDRVPTDVHNVERLTITTPSGQTFDVVIMHDAIKIREDDLGYLLIEPEAANVIVVRRRP